jgi:nucleoid DNA-binding protein
MTKRDIVVRISNETGLVQQQVLDVVQRTLDYIAEAVAHGRKVELRNFGVFEVKIRKARIGRNPNAADRLFLPLVLTLALLEALGLYGFVIAIILTGRL